MAAATAEAEAAARPRSTGPRGAATLGASSDTLPPRQSKGERPPQVIPPIPEPYPLDRKSLGGMVIDDYTLGGKGWREYRKTGGKVYYARDRWYERESGEWVKKSGNRRDLSSLTGEQYEQWKAKRAAARERRKQQGTRSRDIRQVVIE